MARLSLSKASKQRPLWHGPAKAGTAQLLSCWPELGPAAMARRGRRTLLDPRTQVNRKTDESGWRPDGRHCARIVRLSAGYAHVAGECRPLVAAVDDEIVALGLARDRLRDGCIEEIVAFRGAQRGAQIGGVFLTETHVERARASHPHAIAGFAEIVGERRDKTEPAAGLGNLDVARGPAAAIFDVLELEAFGQPRPHDRERKVLIEAAFADVAERHYLDQRKLHAAPVRPFQQRRKLVLVHAFEGHRIDLDLQPGRLRGIDSGQDLVKLTPARDGAELIDIQRVERDVDALDAATHELARIFRQL